MAYLLTVSRMDMSNRRKRWTDAAYRPTIQPTGTPERPMAYPGLLVLVDDNGDIRHGTPLDSPKGLLRTDAGLLVACFSEVRAFTDGVTESVSLVSEPWCNDLHSLRPSPNGFLVASAGVDAASEVSPDGKTLWTWWGGEHGFAAAAGDWPKSLEPDDDHRMLIYPVEMQSTHINAMAALDEQTFLATIFHHNVLVSVDRDTGDWSTLLGGLRQPHAIRVLGDGLISLADSRSGTAILARVDGQSVTVVQRVDAHTTWLQDAYFDGEGWTFVDGTGVRVIHADSAGRVLQVDTFDPEWCLYETLPWAEA